MAIAKNMRTNAIIKKLQHTLTPNGQAEVQTNQGMAAIQLFWMGRWTDQLPPVAGMTRLAGRQSVKNYDDYSLTYISRIAKSNRIVSIANESWLSQFCVQIGHACNDVVGDLAASSIKCLQTTDHDREHFQRFLISIIDV